MSTFKPMLASPADLDKIPYPIYGSAKLDGIRAAVVGGKLLSRTLKEIPSRHIFNMLSQPQFEGLDGELIVGLATAEDCYRNTVSHVMADDKVFAFNYYVFDVWTHSAPFAGRIRELNYRVVELNHPSIRPVGHTLLNNREELDEFEQLMVAHGHEGIMLARTDGSYKFGRATTKGGELLKVKRYLDSEARITGVQEEMHNTNEKQTNELGRGQRSTAKDGLVGKGTMGALEVEDVVSGIPFNIGTGFTAADRAKEWKVGDIVKYKYFPIGVKEKPRHPVFLGMRPAGA